MNNLIIWHEERFSSFIILLAGILAAIVFIILAFITSSPLLFWLLALTVGFLVALFFTLSVVADSQDIYISYAAGLINITIPIHGIASAEVIPNNRPLTYLYNPASGYAVQVTLRDGRVYRFSAQKSRQVVESLQAKMRGL